MVLWPGPDPSCSFFMFFSRLPYAPNSEICAQNCFFPVLMLAHMLFFALCARYMLVFVSYDRRMLGFV